MSKKILTRFNIQTELLELIQSEADKQHISKHDYLNQLLYDKLIKGDNRLSHHVARHIENLILLLMTRETKFETIPAVFHEADQIDRVKREFLSIRRNTLSKRAKTMWAKLMKELAPASFKSLKSRDEAIEKLKAIYDIVASHQEVFE